MPRPDAMRLGVLVVCIGAGAFLGKCLVFDDKSATQPDGAIDARAVDSEADTGSEAYAATAPDPGIRCGANDWCSPDTVCCMKLGATGWFGPATQCSAPGTCENFSQFACDTAQECGDGGAPRGDFCCATRESAATEFQGSSCVPMGACIPAPLALVLCTPTDRAPCPAHESCMSADAGELPPGYYACQ
jgi:hypothetical protein